MFKLERPMAQKRQHERRSTRRAATIASREARSSIGRYLALLNHRLAFYRAWTWRTPDEAYFAIAPRGGGTD